MVYVTVGSHDQPFDRLIIEMDRIAGRLGLEIVIQKGCSRYTPEHAQGFDYLPFDEAEEKMNMAEAVVGHAGIGTVISARRCRKPLLILPRRRKFGEHFNDHQLEIANALLENPIPGISVALEAEELEHMLANLLGKTPYPGIGGESGAGIKAELARFMEAL